MVELTFNNSTKHKGYSIKFFQKVLDYAAKEAKLSTKKIGLSINLVGNSKIRTLNKKYRGKDKATDVLSFPLSTEIPGKSAKNDIMELGDIFICPDVAVKKAKELKSNLKQEMNFLTVHGFLHLLGYDHEKSAKEEKKMFDLQDKILNKLNR